MDELEKWYRDRYSKEREELHKILDERDKKFSMQKIISDQETQLLDSAGLKHSAISVSSWKKRIREINSKEAKERVAKLEEKRKLENG